MKSSIFVLMVAALALVLAAGCDDEPADGDGDVDTDVDTDSDGDTDGDGDVDTDVDTDVDSDADGVGDGDADTDADGDADSDVEGDADGDADSDADADGTCSAPFNLNMLGTATSFGLTYTMALAAGAGREVGSCGGAGAEVVFAYTPDADGLLVATTLHGTGFDSVLHVRTACGDAESEVGCNDDSSATQQSMVAFEVAAGTTYYIIADAFAAVTAGTLVLEVGMAEVLAHGETCDPTDVWAPCGAGMVCHESACATCDGVYTPDTGAFSDGLCWEDFEAPPSPVTWQAGLDYCASLGGSWRMPNINELRQIIVGCMNARSVCRVADPGCLRSDCRNPRDCRCTAGGRECYTNPVFSDPCTWYWSSSAAAGATSAWRIDFTEANIDLGLKTEGATTYVRCVSDPS